MQKRTFLKSVTGLLFTGSLGLSHAARAADAAAKTDAKKRIAFVYFSKTGNTRKVAEAIRSLTGADLCEVTTKEPYPEEYTPTTEIVKEEIEKGIEREIVAPKIDLSKYDVMILGTPTWWHHVAQALQTWVKSVDLKGKTVAHYNTHGGGGRMHTEEDFLKLLPENKHLGHLTVRGSAWGLTGDVEDWLKEIGLL